MTERVSSRSVASTATTPRVSHSSRFHWTALDDTTVVCAVLRKESERPRGSRGRSCSGKMWRQPLLGIVRQCQCQFCPQVRRGKLMDQVLRGRRL